MLMTIRIGHRLHNGLQEVSGKHGGGADEGLFTVGLDLARTPSSSVRSRLTPFQPGALVNIHGNKYIYIHLEYTINIISN